MFLLLCLVQIFELEQDEEYHIPHNSPVKPRKSPSLIMDQKRLNATNENFPNIKFTITLKVSYFLLPNNQ